MRGSVTRQSKTSWRLRWDGGIAPETGRRRQLSRTVRGTKREAEAQLARLLGTDSSGGSHSLTELVAAWFELTEENLSPLTIDGRRRTWQLHVEPTLGKLPVRQINASHLDALYTKLRKQGKTPTAIKVHALLHGALKQAVKWDWVAVNVAERATPPKQPKTRVKVPNLAHVAAMLVVADERWPEFGVLVRLDAATGMRRGELCALRWSDIDLDAGVIHLRRGVISVVTDADRAAAREAGRRRPRGRLVEKDTKTERSDRDPSIGPRTVELLRQHRVRTAERLLKLGLALTDDHFVFPATVDATNPIHPSTVSHRWGTLRDQLGIDGLRLHDLRHHSASQLIAAGTNLRRVMERHGWTSLATAQRYIHAVDEDDRAAAAALEAVLG